MTREGPYPKGVPFSINYPEIPIYAFLENSARKYPQRDALIFYGNRIRYDELWDQARRLAASLKGLGVGKGDRVGLLLPNVPQFVIAYYATLTSGGIVVAINPLNTVEEVERELHETETETLIALDRFLPKIPEEEPKNVIIAETEAYLPPTMRLMSRLRRKRIALPKDVMMFEELLDVAPIRVGSDIDAREDLAAIQYTGGTTGQPKGVMLTHFNLVANALQTFYWIRGWGFSAKPQPAGWPVVVCAVPFFHIYGMTVAMNEAIHFGSTLVLVPDPQPEAIMRAIHRYIATHLPATPQMIRGVVDHPSRGKYKINSLTSCVAGGASIEPALVDKFVEVTGAQLYQGYGLTEAGPVTHCTHVEGDPKPRSVGLPFPDTEAKIVDLQTGEVELSPGEEGEIVVRGPQVMGGYWRNPETTEKTVRNGWLYTGDVGRLDEDGYLYIVDRKEERVISSGHTVWPSRVEEVLESHPVVGSAAALGVPDPLRCATEIRAVVTLKHGWDREKAEQELLEFCREQLEPYRVPSRIVVVESLPKTPLGKVDRRALRIEISRLDEAA